jgi:Ca2+-binding EF-hand superfamily protein
MLFIGLAYIVLGYSATEKLKEVRKKAFPARKVRELFQQYDVDDSGRIEFEEFFKLLKDMNVDIAVQEAELMYLSLDKDMNHGLRFEEFQGFWENSNELSFRI